MNKSKKSVIAAWMFYIVIVFEIIYMISPFGVYYYSVYGPSLNLFNKSPMTSWLSSFFLPHIVETSSFILNSIKDIGWLFIIMGLSSFMLGAGQIYYHKFTKKAAVTGGIYKIIRHPQYVSLAIAGLGMLLVWPRFIVLMMYVTMLFVYYFLAKHEEMECEDKFGESYRAYKSETSMFIPIPMPAFINKLSLPNSGFKKVLSILSIYSIVIVITLFLTIAIRNYGISQISAVYSKNSATVSMTHMNNQELNNILQIALNNLTVQGSLKNDARYLNYVIPQEWYLSDLPMNIPSEIHGHYQPENYNKNQYKIIFTQAKTLSKSPAENEGIIKDTSARLAVLEVSVDTATGTVTQIQTPPKNVRWGDIPTPLI
ncbi:MAG: isoprenylcysteine carboxylmethyltransferase family protein [Desulfobacterales bacterium]|nr:isoprenylcysteine carboxylmethyltransferase family protein [Desulfobacterales bacterium]